LRLRDGAGAEGCQQGGGQEVTVEGFHGKVLSRVAVLLSATVAWQFAQLV
jgi:hypothetical protein